MELFWMAVACLGGFFLGIYRPRLAASPNPALRGQASALADDRARCLFILRRELANYMVRIDPDRYLQLYRKARALDAEIQSNNSRSQKAQLDEITQKFPMYDDLDFIGSREHVLYADVMSRHSCEDVEEHFLTLVKFQSLQQALSEFWKYHPATTDKDLEHLSSYIRKIKDTKFKQKLDAAIAEFYRNTDPYKTPDSVEKYIYETNLLAVCRVPHIPENRYGFHFKDSDEFGLYSFFYADNRDKPYESFYRSDATFKAETNLDHLMIEELI